MNSIELADNLAVDLQSRVSDLPDGFHDTFRFTQTGNNYTHPITLALLASILSRTSGVARVGIDLRLNLGNKVKFQPDLAGLDADFRPLAFIDYESPNSSDSRLPEKDVDAYVAWRQESNAMSVPYVIVTTLPNRRTDDWELRYASRDYYNHAFQGKESEIQQNPFSFWYGYYQKQCEKRDMKNIAFINIDGRVVRRAYPAQSERKT